MKESQPKTLCRDFGLCRKFSTYKYILATVAILCISFHCFSQTRTDSVQGKENTHRRLKINGTLFYTSISRGGIQRDKRNPTLIPLKKYTLYVINLAFMDSIPKVTKRFTSNKNGKFSISLPPGKYGFVTFEEVKTGLSKGQCLPTKRETNNNNIINSSVWECSMPCPIEINASSIKNVVIINHLISFCMNCP